MIHDLTEAHRRILQGSASAQSLLEASIAAAGSSLSAHAFLSLSVETARSAAQQVDRARESGRPVPRLAGLAISIKDLFDVAGEVTTAGSTILAADPSATTDAPAVQRLRDAGAALIGRTNMSEFAFSGVGINPHFGTPANAAQAAQAGKPRIPGGSTSGGAVSVASGAAWAALGSDTGGSIRIPAALQGLVGFKSTAQLVPTTGAVPLSTTLDTACAITRSVRDAVVMHEVLADRPLTTSAPPLRTLRLAMPKTLMLDSLDATVGRAFERTLSTLRRQGAEIEEIDLGLLAEVTSINAAGGFAPAEAWAWHRQRIAAHAQQYDPRVAQRIRRGEAMSAADYIDLLQARRSWILRMQVALAPYDGLLSPTVPIVAPLLEPLLTDDAAFFAVNGALLRNPSCVNLLDGCALSMPCQEDGELPVGLMVWSSAMRDDAVLQASLAIEAALALPRHAA